MGRFNGQRSMVEAVVGMAIGPLTALVLLQQRPRLTTTVKWALVESSHWYSSGGLR